MLKFKFLSFVDRTFGASVFLNSIHSSDNNISSTLSLLLICNFSLNSFFNTNYSDKHIAILAQKVERNYIGVSGGIMDQMVSSIGIHRKAFFLDCLSLKFELIALPPDWVFCLVDSAVQRNLRESAYNERYSQLKKAEEYLGAEYLGSIKPEQFDENKINDELILKRARHVITENARVLEAKECIINGDIKSFGNLMNESHQSMDDDYEISSPELNHVVNVSRRAGALGARLTGACLLYTSPSPRDATLSRMPSSA